MTIGTATVARTNVRATGDIDASRSPRVRFRAVKVGNTQIQIITASWCRLGGGTRAARFSAAVSVMGLLGVDGGSRRGGDGDEPGRAVDVVLDEVGVDRDGDRG